MDFENDWKVVTLWIGANDLFNYCKNDKYIPEKYIGGIREALDILHKEVPKVFVNLVQAADVTKLSPINQNSKYCRVVHSICCDCALTKGDTVKMKVSEAAQKYQKLIVELVSSGR